MLMLLSSCTENYDISYAELKDRYDRLERENYDLQNDYYDLEQECQSYQYELNDSVSREEYDRLQEDYEALEDDLSWNYIHRDEVHENYILEDDVLDFLKDIYDEEGDYVHKDRIEELINYYCW